ncbi:hypothetical protein RhiirA4_479317, partial [Rhizophagus irregularis]
SEEDTSIGQTSVALRILYEHFISNDDKFNKTIVILITINILKNNIEGYDNPFREIVHAVGGLSCSGSKIFYVLILAGTIQGPLEEMFRESKYRYIPTTLGSGNSEISKFVACTERNHDLKDHIESGRPYGYKFKKFANIVTPAIAHEADKDGK